MTRIALPAYRLKIPCADEGEFRERFAPRYASGGIFVPAKDPLAVGTRVHIKLEFRGGQVLVSGDAMVTSRTPPEKSPKPGMTMRLTALHPSSIQFELSPTAPVPAVTPAPALPSPLVAPASPSAARASGLHDLFDLADEEPELAAGGGAPHAQLLPEEDFSDVDPTPLPAPVQPAPPAPFTESTESHSDEPGPTRILVNSEAERRAEATPDLRPSAGPGLRRYAVGAVAALAVVVAIASTAAIVGARSRSPRPPPAAARVEDELRLADARLQAGRLADAGGDSALDHLLAAKALAPGDARVAATLALLADSFEQFGERALARRNFREAAVHFEAAVRADPGRDAARKKLADATSRSDGAATGR